MPFTDLQQELQKLGYEAQWPHIQQQMAQRKAQVNASDLQRIKQHNKKFPQKHKAAKARWAKKRFEQIKPRIGKQKCHQCQQLMMSADLIGQNRLKGFCLKCRNKLLGE